MLVLDGVVMAELDIRRWSVSRNRVEDVLVVHFV
jgi:hypothetical protein